MSNSKFIELFLTKILSTISCISCPPDSRALSKKGQLPTDNAIESVRLYDCNSYDLLLELPIVYMYILYIALDILLFHPR